MIDWMIDWLILDDFIGTFSAYLRGFLSRKISWNFKIFMSWKFFFTVPTPVNKAAAMWNEMERIVMMSSVAAMNDDDEVAQVAAELHQTEAFDNMENVVRLNSKNFRSVTRDARQAVMALFYVTCEWMFLSMFYVAKLFLIFACSDFIIYLQTAICLLCGQFSCPTEWRNCKVVGKLLRRCGLVTVRFWCPKSELSLKFPVLSKRRHKEDIGNDCMSDQNSEV